MLRAIFVIILIIVGGFYALQSPFYSLLFYMGNAYFRPEEWVWFDFVSPLNLSLLSGAIVVAGSFFSTQRFVWNGRVALIWLFLLHTLFSTLGSENFVYSWGYWTDFLKTIIMTYMIVVLVNDYSKFRVLLLVIVLALGLEQAKQGWVYLVTAPDWYNPNEIPFLGDNNGVAVGMLMLVPVVAFLAQTTDKKWAKYFYWVLLVGCLFRALSTQSRAGFLAALAMGVVWWVRTQRKMRALIGIGMIALIVVPALPDTYWNRMRTIETYEEEQDRSAQGRLHFWAVAIRMANANPLLGVGYFGYNPSYDKYDFSEGFYGKERSVHSSPLGVLAELGYPGAFLFAFIILGALRACSLVRKLAIREAALSHFGKGAVALQASFIAFLVGGSFVSFQYSEMLWHMIGLTIVIERLANQRHAELLSDNKLASPGGSVPRKVLNAA